MRAKHTWRLGGDVRPVATMSQPPHRARTRAAVVNNIVQIACMKLFQLARPLACTCFGELVKPASSTTGLLADLTARKPSKQTSAQSRFRFMTFREYEKNNHRFIITCSALARWMQLRTIRVLLSSVSGRRQLLVLCKRKFKSIEATRPVIKLNGLHANITPHLECILYGKHAATTAAETFCLRQVTAAAPEQQPLCRRRGCQRRPEHRHFSIDVF